MPAEVRNITETFVPEWLRNLWYEVVTHRYTGPLTLHVSEGRVKQIETREMRKPEDFRD